MGINYKKRMIFSHLDRKIRHKWNAKMHSTVACPLYFKDEEGKFKTKPINKIQKLIEAPKIVKRRTCYCGECTARLLVVLKKSDKLVMCGSCESIMSLEGLK